MLLSGIRVLDFGRYVAGPYTAALLADLGAEVIRIERLAGGDDRYLCPVTDDGTGALFLQLNRNKKGLTLNPMKPEGREVMQRLIATADVIVVNMPAKAQAAMGLDYASVSEIKSDIILCSQSAFGDQGPYRDRPGFDGVAQAMSGATHMTGFGDQPTKATASWCDFGTASFSAFGIMAALLHRERTGEGQEVKANLLRTGLNFFHFNNIHALMHGAAGDRIGNRSLFGGPSDLFQCSDGWVQVQVMGKGLFDRWCDMISEPDLKEDSRYQTDVARAEHGALLSAHMQRWCDGKSRAEVMAALDEAGIPAGEMLSPLEVFEDPQVRTGDLLQDVTYPGLPRPAPLAGHPVEYSTLKAPISKAAPELGADTQDVLKGLGYTDEQIAALHANRVA